MPTSEKQIEANRRNAQLSTGPVTPEGKLRAAFNASRHALTGQVVVMSAEEGEAFKDFSSKMIAEYDPRSVLELQLAQRIAKALWRLNRIGAVEDNMFALGQCKHANEVESNDPQVHAALTTAVTYVAQAHDFERLTLYEQRTNRELNKNIDTLLKLKAARRPVPISADPPQNGFVFANDHFTAGATSIAPDLPSV